MKKTLLIYFFFAPLLLTARPVKREMRGTWIATVANIDWPRTQGGDPEKQKDELVEIFDNVVASNMNCVILQIRPTADAFYRSAHEPWSHWITGRQGTAPAFDPLEFTIDECDKRGIAVHVWINPYRVWLDRVNLSPETEAGIRHRFGDLLVNYGKSMYLHPADQRAREHICRVVADIVENYDIDAIHMDDYFYPYRVAGEEFPDESYFRRDPRGFTRKDDWRRDNVDRVIEQLHRTIREIKPWVEFGISPFGVWRNGHVDPSGSATRAGVTNYDDLYADILKWEREGWIDYVAPQLYWHIGFQIADYRILADWWDANSNNTITYIGHALYRIDPKSSVQTWRTPMEIIRQIQLNRRHSHIQGSFLYSSKFLADPNLRDHLTGHVYQSRSLWPVSTRIEPVEPQNPGTPVMYTDWKNIYLSWQPENDNRRFVIYCFAEGTEPDFEDPSRIIGVTGESLVSIPLDSEEQLDCQYYVSALSLTHHESDPVKVTYGYLPQYLKRNIE